MMTMEELQKACETLAEAWNKALEQMEKFERSLRTHVWFRGKES